MKWRKGRMALVKRALIAVLMCGVFLEQAQAATKRTRTKNRLPAKPVGVDLPGELLLQTGHAAWVTSVAFSPDGQLLASGGADGTTKLWAVQSREVLRTFSGPTADGMAVAFSPDGKLLASACADGTVNMWAIPSGELAFTLKGHAAPVTAVAFSPDGQLLATASADKTVKLWLVHNRQELRSIPAHMAWVTAVAFSPNGQLLATAGADKTVKLWTLRTPGKPRKSQRTSVGQPTAITEKLLHTLVG